MLPSWLTAFLVPFLGLAAGFAAAQAAPAPSGPSTTTTAAPRAVATVAPKTPAEFFARARQLSDLRAAGIPFHLKATYTATGDAEFTGSGTYETWWKSQQDWRVAATLASFRYSAVMKSGTLQIFASGSYIPLRLRQAMSNAVMRIPQSEVNSQGWKVQSKHLQGVDWVYLLKSEPCRAQTPKIQCPEGRFFTHEGVLRISQHGTMVTVYNDLQPFRDHLVPLKVSIGDVGQPALTLMVNVLEPLPADPGNSWQSAVDNHGLTPIQAMKKVAQIDTARVLRAPAPSYPYAAKQARISGTVVMHVTIDDKGAVREPYILLSAGHDLDQAALQAVRRWRYQPIEADGKPMQVDTTITVIFTLHS